MIIISNTLDFELYKPTAVAIGKFDGVHIGHQRLLREILEKKEIGLDACVMTFDPSPAVFFGMSDGRELSTKEEKRRIFEQMGVNVLVEFPLTKESAGIDPEEFVKEILVKRIHAEWIAAGKDISFGNKGKGNEALLRKLAEECNYQVTTIDKICILDCEVSSSYIKALIEEGKVKEASAFLGTPYTISGTVEHGRKLGRSLGIPTVNVIPSKDKLMPPNGVYYSKVNFAGESFSAISNIGCKPTVSDEKVIGLESYLYDFDRNIYGETVDVQLLEFRRSESKFDSVEQLKETMVQDLEAGRKYHTRE